MIRSTFVLTAALAGAICFAPAFASAQPAARHPLTLSESIQYALAHDTTVQQNVATLATAQNALAKQKGQSFPVINGTLQNQLDKSSPGYGGQFAVIGAQQQTIFSQNTAQIGTNFALNSGGLGLIQIAEQQALVDSDRAALKRSQDLLANTVTGNFYAIAQKNALVAIDRSDLAYQHILTLNAKAKVHAGVAAAVDVLRAQVAESKSKSTLVGDEAAIEDARETLAQSIGAPLDTTFDVPAEVPQPPLPQGSLDKLISIAQSARPDVLSAQYSLRNARLVRKGFSRELFPMVQLGGSFGNQFSPTNAVFEQNMINQQFAQENLLLISQGLPPLPLSARETVPRGAPGYWNIFATSTFTLPLLDYGQRHTERLSDDAAVRNEIAALDDAEGRAELDVRENYRAAMTALTQLDYAQEESRLGVEAARIAQLQYQAGIIAFSDVSQAQQTSVTAQSDLINARVNYVVAVVKLRVALGIFDAQSAVADLR